MLLLPACSAILEQHRAECEANHQYVEAEVATRRLQELRAHEVKRRKEAYRSRHIAEKLDVEEAHLLEIEVRLPCACLLGGC